MFFSSSVNTSTMYRSASPCSSSSCLRCAAFAVLAARALVGRLEDADEPARRLVVVADAPVAPRALEEREAVERRVDLVLVREHLLVLGERARVVELAVEDRLGLGHVRVGHEAALRVVAAGCARSDRAPRLPCPARRRESRRRRARGRTARTTDSRAAPARRDRAARGSRARAPGRGCRRASSPTPGSGRRSRRARSPTGAHLGARAPRASRGPRAASRRRTWSRGRWPRRGAPWSGATSASTRASRRAWSCLRRPRGSSGPRMLGCPLEPRPSHGPRRPRAGRRCRRRNGSFRCGPNRVRRARWRKRGWRRRGRAETRCALRRRAVGRRKP